MIVNGACKTCHVKPKNFDIIIYIIYNKLLYKSIMEIYNFSVKTGKRSELINITKTIEDYPDSVL